MPGYALQREGLRVAREDLAGDQRAQALLAQKQGYGDVRQAGLILCVYHFPRGQRLCHDGAGGMGSQTKCALGFAESGIPLRARLQTGCGL